MWTRTNAEVITGTTRKLIQIPSGYQLNAAFMFVSITLLLLTLY